MLNVRWDFAVGLCNARPPTERVPVDGERVKINKVMLARVPIVDDVKPTSKGPSVNRTG